MTIFDDVRTACAEATARGLDYLLWNRGQEPAYKAIPRHRTRTVFYYSILQAS